MPDSLLKSLCTKQGLIKLYLLTAPPNGQVWHKAFFGGSGRRAVAQTRPTFPKMPRATSAFPREGHQVINLTPLKRVKVWGDGPLRLEEINNPTRMPDSLNAEKPLHDARVDQASELFLVIDFYRLSRTLVFWPSTRPKMPFKVMHRKEVTHSNGS